MSFNILQLMQADPHKLDFRSELLARLPGAGGLGPLGPIGGAVPPTHDLTRPPSLFSTTGALTTYLALAKDKINILNLKMWCLFFPDKTCVPKRVGAVYFNFTYDEIKAF